MFSAAMLGLAIHNIPLIRDYFPSPGTVRFAQYAKPFGYSLLLADGERTVSLKAIMPGAWPPKWQLRVFGKSHRLEVEFPPSYVLAGSATAHLHGPGGSRSYSFAESGYQAQWKHLHDVAEQGALSIRSAA
jgi:myo-inositol 2-dehydrogenase/D-chiro-inositol 1-dehydrogenase